MKTNLSPLTLATLALAGVLCSAVPARAHVAGGTTAVGVSVAESTQIAMGWSVKKTLMGKTIYNDAGQKVGKVEDLIISPDKSVSYVIVGAGGFVGIGRHDVAVPVTQIEDRRAQVNGKRRKGLLQESRIQFAGKYLKGEIAHGLVGRGACGKTTNGRKSEANRFWGAHFPPFP